jgi:DNA-binding MarR family transcriptional regulator
MTDAPVPVPVDILNALLRLHSGVRRRFVAHIGVPLTVRQASLLWTLGETDVPTRMSELARRLDLNNRTITPMVDALEREQLVSRRTDPHDRRAILVELTPRGRARRDAICLAQEDISAELVATLTTDEQAQLNGLLRRVVDNLLTQPQH